LTTDFGVGVIQAGAGGSPLVLFLRNDTLFAQEFDMATLAVTGTPVTVMEQVGGTPNGGFGHFSVSKNGTLVYRSVTGNNRQLTWFNRQGDIVGRPGERAPYGTMKVSPDGTRAAVVQNDPRQPGNSDLWIVDLTSGASTRFTFDPGFDGQPVWSPDGRSIAWWTTQQPDGPLPEGADGTAPTSCLRRRGFSNVNDWTTTASSSSSWR
jgi:dipeptidyl aminopeptidase/acylaminoacyl peptidase